MAEYQILYWKDIPAQVRAREGTRQVKRLLPERFQHAIDARAAEEGATSEDSYLTGWRWGDWQSRPGSPEEVADKILTELESVDTTL